MLLMTGFIVRVTYVLYVYVLFHSNSRQIFKAEHMQLNNWAALL